MTTLKVWNGTTWEYLTGGAAILQQASAPASPTEGDLWIDTDASAVAETYYSYSNTALAAFTPSAAVSGTSFTIAASATQRLFHVVCSVSHHGSNALGTHRAWSIRLDSTRVIPKWSRTEGGNIHNDDGAFSQLNDSLTANAEGYNVCFSGILVVPGDSATHAVDLYCQAVDDVTATVVTQYSIVATRVG